jgi:putative tricarboxylic transport membrane protein
MAGPGITAEQKQVLTETVEKAVKSKEWAEILKQRGWEDFYLAGAPFETFLKEEQTRVGDVLKSIGLVKS